MSLAGPSWRAVLKNSKLSETRSKKTSGIFLTQSLLVLNPFAGWELSDILRFLKTRHYYHRLTKSWAFKVLLFSRKLFRFSETFIKQTIVQPHKSQAGQISSRLQAEPTRNAAPSEVVGGKGRGGRTQEDKLRLQVPWPHQLILHCSKPRLLLSGLFSLKTSLRIVAQLGKTKRLFHVTHFLL